MKTSLEKEVMVSLYLAPYVNSRHKGREWFRFNEVAEISKLGKSTLQRILPRLESRGWIESWRGESFSDAEPAMAEFHFDSYPNPRVPVEILNDYGRRVASLKRKVKDVSEGETYADAIRNEEQSKRKRKAISDVPFKGKAAAWRRAFSSAQPRQHTFYRVVAFPYVHEVIFPYGKKVLVPYGSNYSSVPEGDRRLWYGAAKEVLRVIEASKQASN